MEFIDLKRQYQKYKTDIDAQISDVLLSANFIMGKPVAFLEELLAQFVGTQYALGCSSGTDALLLPLMAYDIQPGDEIITTPFTFVATSEVIALLKAKPVFVDIDEATFNLEPTQILEAITPRTRGIIPVDLFGQCADYDEINAIADHHGLFVIEDAAQSFGARYRNRPACSLANVGCTSFFPAKPLGCYGDGGMVFTDDERLFHIMESLRIHGKGKDKYDNVRVGLNARLDTLQAAILMAKFKHYHDEIRRRHEVADYYNQRLKDYVNVPFVLPYNESVYAQYSIITKERDLLQKHLTQKGIPTAIHYPKPLHRQSAFAYLGYKEGDFPVAEKVCREILALPMHPFLTREEQDQVVQSIRSFYR